MDSASRAVKPVPAPEAAASPPKRHRLIELDTLRGFLLLWMTLTHLPTKASIISNQTFGFVSGAEGFIFLSAFMVGQLEQRLQARSGESATVRDIAKRTLRIYGYHSALLLIAFFVFAEIGVAFQRLPIENLLSFYLQDPWHALVAAFLLKYKPSLLDILPMYIVFMALTPPARKAATRWGWDPIIYVSFAIWAPAQFGLRAWLYQHVNLVGPKVPENSIGAFDFYSWQLLWMVGLALGTIYADRLAEPRATGRSSRQAEGIPRWLTWLSVAVAIIFLVLRYSRTDRWIDPNALGWLIDKWHLGPARVINFAALTIVLVEFGSPVANLPILRWLSVMGQASLEVFCVHILCCLAGNALSREADPQLHPVTQVLLLTVTISLLLATAYAHRRRTEKRHAASLPKLAPA
jgi:hypothetical protein